MFHSYQVGEDRFILSSGLLTLGSAGLDDFTSSACTFIFAHDCVMVGDVKAKELHLHTATFTCNETSTFQLSGRDGDNGWGSSMPEPGEAAGSLILSSNGFDYKARLNVHARGGTGGRGGVSWSDVEDGADGGDGGWLSFMFSDTYTATRDSYGEYDDAANADKPNESAVQALAKSWLERMRPMANPADPTLCRSMDALCKKLNETDENGCRVLMPPGELRAAMLNVYRALGLYKPASDIETDVKVTKAADRAPGRGGAGGPGNPDDGGHGRGGKSGAVRLCVVKACMDAATIWDSDEMLFHPDQLEMTLRDAYAAYFEGSAESLAHCGRVLAQLVDRLAFLADADTARKRAAPLWNAYHEHEARLGVLPSGGDTPTSITTMLAVRQRALLFLGRLRAGLDVFGHGVGWVPRGSLRFHWQQTEQLLRGLGTIETTYHAYQKRDYKERTRRQWVADAVAAAEASETRSEAHAQEREVALRALAKRIEEQTSGLPDKKKRLVAAVHAVEEEIRDVRTFSLRSFIDSCQILVFASSPETALLMGGFVGLKTLHDMLTTVENEAGDLVDKKCVIDQVHDMDGTLAGLKDGVHLAGNGALETDDPGGVKLLTTKAALMDLLRQYRGVVKEWRHIEALFDDYTTSVLARNSSVLEYNDQLLALLQDRVALANLRDKVQRMQAHGLDKIDPDLPLVAVVVAQAYHLCVDHVLHQLYRVEHALAFWAVDLPIDHLAVVHKAGIDSAGLTALLEMQRNAILAAYTDAVEKSTSAYQRFGDWSHGLQGDDPASDASDASAGWELRGSNTPLCYQLADHELQPLCDGDGRTAVVMTSMHEKQSVADNVFFGMRDVRLTRVRFVLETAQGTIAATAVRVALRHDSAEIICTVDNVPMPFLHSSLDFAFIYKAPWDPANPQIVVDGDMADSPDPQLQSYALYGPFTIWYIVLDPDANPDLDPSTITGARMEFTGWCKWAPQE